MEDERFDGLFLNVAQQCQGIDPLLDSLFSFLRRKTDFFVGVSHDKAEEVVLKVVRKHAALSERTEAVKKAERQKEELKRKEKLEKKRKEEELEIEKQRLANAKDLKFKSTAKPDDDVIEVSDDGVFDVSSTATSTPPPVPVEADDPLANIPEIKVNDSPSKGEEEEDPTPPPPGNGGSTDKYVWTQTLGDLNVVIPVPIGTKTKMLSVDITNKRLKVGMKGQPPIIDGEFHKRVIVDDCFWTLEDGREISLSLQKENKMEWWKCVIVGDVEIDTTKVQPENSKLGDLDAETRQTVEKMMFDQRQKAMGLPSSEELQKQEMLKKFMASHPEMDFSKAKFS